MPKRLEAKLESMVRSGKRPAVLLRPGEHIRPPKRPAHRPRKNDPNNPYAHFAGYMGKRSKPICRAKGCTKELRVHQAMACSPECADQIFNQAIVLLRGINATAEEILTHLYPAQATGTTG